MDWDGYLFCGHVYVCIFSGVKQLLVGGIINGKGPNRYVVDRSTKIGIDTL